LGQGGYSTAEVLESKKREKRGHPRNERNERNEDIQVLLASLSLAGDLPDHKN
jgi:hypothetical protein